MEPEASLKQTVTNLFDAVRYGTQARELEGAAKGVESTLGEELSKLESRSEELSNLLSSIKEDPADTLKDFAKKVQEFLDAAREQAKEKLTRSAKEEIEEYGSRASAERDKATKSLEAYLASSPLPVIESVVSVKLTDGVYEARSRFECEGGIRYEFRLAPQNSKLFAKELKLSQLGYDLRIPVRLSRPLLKKERIPGFERMDQYVLLSAEASSGRIRADFQREGNGAKLKVVSSDSGNEGFVSLEYVDQIQFVNVMNDPSLSPHVQLDTLKKAMGELVTELADLAKKKVALLRLSLNGNDLLKDLDFYRLLQLVLSVRGSDYRAILKRVSDRKAEPGEGAPLNIGFINERLKILGDRSPFVSEALGLEVTR